MVNQKLKSLFKVIIGRKENNQEQKAFFQPPYDYVQTVTEKYIHRYIGLEAEDLKSWCIVGGFLGSEAVGIMNYYPQVNVTIFECSQRYIASLAKQYQDDQRVEVVHRAVSNSKGITTFYENSLDGIGSLLKPGRFLEESYGTNQAESYEVETITLDEYLNGSGVDVLQIDVQGAEKLVLEGASGMLQNTKAIFIETSVKPDLYEGAVVFDEIYHFLKQKGFNLILLGTDFNQTGNALFVNSKCSAKKDAFW